MKELRIMRKGHFPGLSSWAQSNQKGPFWEGGKRVRVRDIRRYYPTGFDDRERGVRQRMQVPWEAGTLSQSLPESAQKKHSPTDTLSFTHKIYFLCLTSRNVDINCFLKSVCLR